MMVGGRRERRSSTHGDVLCEASQPQSGAGIGMNPAVGITLGVSGIDDPPFIQSLQQSHPARTVEPDWFTLGNSFLFGRDGVSINEAKAVQYYKLAACNPEGSSDAMVSLVYYVCIFIHV